MNQSQRNITYRSPGKRHGGVIRLASPGDVGQLIKPFVFLDLFHLDTPASKMGMHPHSGIATVTVVLDGALEYRETTGSHGELPAGGIEWMSAGGGVWHEGGAAPGRHVTGFQLWLALPAQDENGPAHSQYVPPAAVPSHGPARVIIGSYGGVHSPIRPRAAINYLHVKLRDGERWTYAPPAGHDVAWTAVAHGALRTAGTVVRKEVAVFESGSGSIEFVAEGATEFVLGSAVRHPHDLVTGHYSVHTSAAALQQGENEIRRIGAQLRAANLM
jgi:redox-sensitive bicupin YhaK (pirin superfamily)